MLVDSSHEDQLRRMPPAIREAQANAARMLTLLRVATFVGALRLQALRSGPPAQFGGASPPVADKMLALSLQPSFGSAVADEMREFERSADAVRRARSFGSRPLVVLSASRLPDDGGGMSAEDAAAFQKVWVDDGSNGAGPDAAAATDVFVCSQWLRASSAAIAGLPSAAEMRLPTSAP